MLDWMHHQCTVSDCGHALTWDASQKRRKTDVQRQGLLASGTEGDWSQSQSRAVEGLPGPVMVACGRSRQAVAAEEACASALQEMGPGGCA
jgi:hypothetical protein